MPQKIFRFWKNLFHSKQTESQMYESSSAFKQFLAGLDDMAPAYIIIKQAVRLADEALRTARQRIALAAKIQNYDKRMKEWEKFHNLTDGEILQINNALDRFTALSSERKSLLEQLTGFDRSIENLRALNNEASKDMVQIISAEENQQLLRTDIGYLEGEKADLEDQRTVLIFGMRFLNRFAVVMVSVFVFVSVLLGYLAIIRETDIFFPASVFIFLLIILSVFIYFFRRHIVFELRLNYQKQIRAVRFLNRKSAVFVYYTNFLRYIYQKYRVRSGRNLRRNLDEYKRYETVAARIDAIRKAMYGAQADIENFLREKKMENLALSLENTAKHVNFSDRKRGYEKLVEMKEQAEKSLAILDARQGELWDKLTNLKKRDFSRTKAVVGVVDKYMEEVGKL
ncbi:MAG: hypothetical protein LBT44_06865 [Clostridiales bacterium]|nr:hypothetical protein [Clostridiales bacterium]